MNWEEVPALKLLEVPHYPLSEKLPVPANPVLSENRCHMGRFSKTLMCYK
jgi:hypothetical protein